MEFDTNLSLEAIITAPIPAKEKEAILQAIKDKLAVRLDWLNDVITEGTPEKVKLKDQIDTIDRIVAKFITYDC